MKKLFILTAIGGTMAVLAGCGGNESPGRAYMPDMTYSVAYETYTDAEGRLKNSGAESTPSFNFTPVPGTVARGDMASYPFANDSAGYVNSATVKSPINKDSVDLKNAERLYLVNCGICHGAKLDGNGPLYNDGNGPYTAAPKNLLADDMKALADGTMFHSITYGKGQMGSYASQLSSNQRWEVIAFIRSKQSPASTTSAPAASGTDSSAAAMTK
jgi:mono/diheme cytochrome c family protein